MIASVTAIRTIAARTDIERAVYSDSIVDEAMHGFSLEHQITGKPMTLTIKPVRDLTESGFVPCSVPHPLSKAASTYISILNLSVL